MADRTITISSAGKTFSVTGWKIGWLHARAEIVDAVAAVKQFLTFVNGSPFQPAIAQALTLPTDAVLAIGNNLAARSELLTAGLNAAGFDARRSDGTYFVIADAAPLGYPDGAALCADLPRLAGVVAVPVQAFQDDPSRPSSLVRFACCKRPEVISEAVDRLAKCGSDSAASGADSSWWRFGLRFRFRAQTSTESPRLRLGTRLGARFPHDLAAST
jgi:N-succinyldiaminopimelate aminotransferase